ncbi:MAG: HAD-IA family hydrolase, partial [Gammaproteobacteria bacterium]|nr:HAD-IA family hydrolase [Gammaproteobacteria bacterium]
MPDIKTLLFDLDGTLIDTAPDMAYALDILRQEEQRKAMPYEQVRPIVSNGSMALVQLGFSDVTDEAELERLKQRYLEIYQDNLCVKSVLFDGMLELLEQAENNDLNWGVVTNKPGWLTDPLMQQIGLFDRAACIVSGDTTRNRKPHPEPIYHACLAAGSKPFECLYVGDARRDIEAGNRAGMPTLIAMYGYI